MKPTLFIALFVMIVAGISMRANAYDYSEPMPMIPGLPLESPEKPFVLRFSEEELMNQPIWSTQVDGIVIQAGADSPIRIGAEALQDSLQKLFAHAVPIIEIPAAQAALPENTVGEWFVILGVPQDFSLAAALAHEAQLDISDSVMNGDGFWVKPIEQGRFKLLLATSPISRGVMYGAYELEERTTRRGVPRIDQAFVPRMRYRGWPIHNHEVPTPLGASGRWRYNMSLEYCAFWPRILPFTAYPELGGVQEAAEIEKQQRALHARFEDCLRYGSAPTLFFNFLTLQWAPIGLEPARKVLAEKYPGILAYPAEKHTYSLCPSHPETRRLVASMVRELAQTFPELEALVLQLSDEGGELLCDCEQCAKVSYLDKIVDYTNLIIATARDVNSNMRFLLFGSGITNKMAMDNAELASGPTMGMGRLHERLGHDIEAYVLMATSPPGFDVQTWMSPDSTALGQGLPLYYLFHWYEAGGPGIVAPISPVMSHLSWPLPLYLEKLKKYAARDSGMIGAASPVTGMDVAWWHPDLNPNNYMRNWCRAKFGREAGDYVFEALPGTDTITQAFYLDTKPNVSESLDMYRWGALGQPWALNMDPLKTVGLGHDDTGQTTLASIAQLGWMMPQAARPDAFRSLTADDMQPWLTRFDLAEEIAAGDRAEAMMAKALSLTPENAELQRLYGVAKATKALIHLFREYHRAVIHASAARNTTDATQKSHLIELARTGLMRASENLVVYKESLLPITSKEKLVRMKRHTEMFYVGLTACLVREAAFLFDQEFGGQSVLRHYDNAIGLSPAE